MHISFLACHACCGLRIIALKIENWIYCFLSLTFIILAKGWRKYGFTETDITFLDLVFFFIFDLTRRSILKVER